MKLFKIEVGNQTFMTSDPKSISAALKNLEGDKSIVIKAEEMTEEEYNKIPASVESCKFFGQWRKK